MNRSSSFHVHVNLITASHATFHHRHRPCFDQELPVLLSRTTTSIALECHADHALVVLSMPLHKPASGILPADSSPSSRNAQAWHDPKKTAHDENV